MVAKTTHFRADNGDMTLIQLESGRRILIDINIRGAAVDPNDETPDVLTQLRQRLSRDAQGRLFIDAFLLTHPDTDHIRGLEEHFHLGPLADWSPDDDKIIIREMWSSPMVFRRASTNHILSPDAKAWNTEARRRVAVYRANYWCADGDKILIMGEDIDGKTNDLGPIVVKVDTTFQTIAGNVDGTFKARLIAPLPASDSDEEDILSKNNSSVILNMTLQSRGVDAANYLFGGDAEVAIWERVWSRHKYQPHVLEYDVLLAPHHCSWHSLSYHSWSLYREAAEVSDAARSALGQARIGAYVIASSKPIKDDDNDPPCIRAKREYVAILGTENRFKCIADGAGDTPFEFEVSVGGVSPLAKAAAVASPFISGVGRQPLPHG